VLPRTLAAQDRASVEFALIEYRKRDMIVRYLPPHMYVYRSIYLLELGISPFVSFDVRIVPTTYKYLRCRPLSLSRLPPCRRHLIQRRSPALTLSKHFVWMVKILMASANPNLYAIVLVCLRSE